MNKNKTVDELPPFFMNSIPKSGTHLLHQILNGIPNLSMDITDSQKKFFNDVVMAEDKYFQNLFTDHYKRFKMLSNNEFGLGHVKYMKEYADMLKTLGLKHIFLYRDPRDILVSMSYFVKDKWPEHPLYEMFQSNDVTSKDRKLFLINGVPGKWVDFYSYIHSFYKWLNHEEIYVISFEDLIRSEQSRKESLLKLVNYLWEGLIPPVPLEKMVDQMIANIDPHKSRTFRLGKIAAWKSEFDDEVKSRFKANAGELLIQYGFEANYDW